MRTARSKNRRKPTARRRVKDIGACCRRSHTARAVDHFFKARCRSSRPHRDGRRARKQGSRTWVTAQRPQRSLGTKILWHRPASRTGRRYPDQKRHRTRARRTIRSRELDVSAASHVGVDGQRAGPYDGHGVTPPWTPFCVQGQMSRGEGSLAFRNASSSRDRRRVGQCKRRQRARPRAAPTCSGSQPST